jgi:hypothetical protein
LLEQVAFNELGLYKIFTYDFDLRSNLYLIFEVVLYIKEATWGSSQLLRVDEGLQRRRLIAQNYNTVFQNKSYIKNKVAW